ncbi:flagellar biosynthesis anti-sigma factor FlgM [Roseateles koreensis]|uniref:Negative regulator of flagellin synthesis n=1 Tax=Roseateles koreensis TaxID=2987526 RepID=A0ABT5KPJ9_9BURK|nr:flagellar biosynthesis anti-sigma factor FlgM [Roseateles koreensis]MDC8784298.1 flagellar biosynthesis anti-sigma factor FlgM [Roseateles koreensis]
MKIANSPDIAATALGTEKSASGTSGRATATGQGAVQGGSKAPQASATIQLSSTATKLLQGVADDGSFDTAKVDRISQAITDGKFTVNAEAVADKLIANAQELMGRMSAH